MSKFSEKAEIGSAIKTLATLGNLQPSTSAPNGLVCNDYAGTIEDIIPAKYNGKLTGLRAVVKLNTGIECYCSLKGSEQKLNDCEESQAVTVTIYQYPESSGNLYSKVIL